LYSSVGLLVRPLVIQGVILLFLGGGALVVALILGRILKPKTLPAEYAQSWDAGSTAYYDDNDRYR
jgi:hypothetical protein